MTHQPTLPTSWNEDLAYLFGLLLGDGTLPITYLQRKNKEPFKRHSIRFFSISKDFTHNVYIPLFKRVFNLEPSVCEVQKKYSILYDTRIESKKAYEFLRTWGFTTGRKARIATIPPTLPKEFEKDLLAGLLDTDGGKKANGFGLSTASPHFAKFCINQFKARGLPYRSCPWHYKSHTYHQIYVGKKAMHKLLETIPLKNKEKISFLRSHLAPVA